MYPFRGGDKGQEVTRDRGDKGQVPLSPEFWAHSTIITGEVGGDGDFFWGKIMKCD